MNSTKITKPVGIAEGKPRLTHKEKLWFDEYLIDFNGSRAALAVLTDNKVSARSLGAMTKKRVFAKLNIDDTTLMDYMGLTDERLYRKIDEGLESNRTISVVSGKKAKGTDMDFVDVPDYAVRHKYVETALKLKGKNIDSKKVELTGADGEPLRIELVAGIGFLNKPEAEK